MAKCDICKERDKQVTRHRSGLRLCEDCAPKQDEYMYKLQDVVVTTADIKEPYEVVGLVKTIQRGKDLDGVVERCIQFLQAQAVDMGCEAIVGLNFQPSAVSEALAGQYRDITYGAVFFAYGTAVKLKLR